MEMALTIKSVMIVMMMGTVKMSLVRLARAQARMEAFLVTRTVQIAMVMASY